MSQADAANTTTRTRAASNIISPVLTGYTVSIADGPRGSYRPLLDEAGEPRIFDRGEQAIDAALVWGRATGKATRIDPIDAPTTAELDQLISDLDTAAGRPALDTYETWLAAERKREDEEDRRRYERLRRAVQSSILERAIADELRYGDAA